MNLIINLSFFIIFIISRSVATTTTTTTTTTTNNNNYLCPEQCKCSVIDKNHLKIHAKCSGLDGLKEDGRNLTIYSLDLTHNNLTRIGNGLDKLKNLIDLNLSNNHLSEIGRFGRRIQKLNISHNHVTSGKLHNLPIHIKYLDLSYNDITYLPIELKNLKYLRSLELIGNKIHCTCETLEIRNWLQKNHVWTDNHIKCSQPIEVKGKSWLQVRQSIVCDERQQRDKEFKEDFLMDDDDDENELMLADDAGAAAITTDDTNENLSGEKEEFEELGKDYLPIDDKNGKKLSEIKAVDETDVEGSGGSNDEEEHIVVPSLDNENLQSETSSEAAAITEQQDTVTESISISVNETEDDSEASGIGPLPTIVSIDTDFSNLTTSEPSEYIEPEEEVAEDNSSEQPVVDLVDNDDNLTLNALSTTTTTESVGNIFGTGLGIVQFPTSETTEDNISKIPSSSSSEEPDKEILSEVSEDTIVPVKFEENEAVATEIRKDNIKLPSDSVADPNDVAEASSGENQNTYILLGVILIILIVLILYVAIKRNRARRNRHNDDAENPKGTELIDMDKKNLGKPIHKNGATTEHAPLINDRTIADLAKPISANGKNVPYNKQQQGQNDKKAQEPLLLNESNDEKEEPTSEQQTESNNNNIPNNTVQRPISPSSLSVSEEQSPKVNQNGKSKPSSTEPVHQYKFGPYPSPSPSKSKPSSGDEGGEGYHHSSSSPRPSRYSPVYSPETGRVKIKLTETPKPKTPLLITRSRSNAGDIITIPATKNAEILKGAASSNNLPNGQ